MKELLELLAQDKEDINQYVYNKIYKYYRRRIERKRKKRHLISIVLKFEI